MKRRLFIESDILSEDELESSKWRLEEILERTGVECSKEVFDEVKDGAWHDIAGAWESVKKADEIYASSSLVPLCGPGSYTGAPPLMDGLMRKAIEEKLEGKSLLFLTQAKGIWWDEIESELLKKCFVKNKLFTLEWNEDKSEDFFQEVDVSTIV